MINGAWVPYLWIDALEAGLLFIHLEVELGGGDGQGAFYHHSRSHELSAGAHVYWAWRTDRDTGRSQNENVKLGDHWALMRSCKKENQKNPTWRKS